MNIYGSGCKEKKFISLGSLHMFLGKFMEILMIEKRQESKPKVLTINVITMMPKEIMSI